MHRASFYTNAWHPSPCVLPKQGYDTCITPICLERIADSTAQLGVPDTFCGDFGYESDVGPQSGEFFNSQPRFSRRTDAGDVPGRSPYENTRGVQRQTVAKVLRPNS